MARQTKKNWTTYSTATLIDLASKGYTRQEIATRLQRTPVAIKRKMHSLKYNFIKRMTFGEFVNNLFN